MKSVVQNKRSKTRKIWIPIVVVLLIAIGGFGYYYWTQTTASTVASTEASYKTSKVRTGSITISASGSGTLVAGKENNLSFSTIGTVAEVDVQVSDVVKKDQVLAKLSNLDQLQASINAAQQDLITAQQALTTLKQNAAANLANAQLKVSTTQKSVTDAKSSVVQKGWVRCDQDTIDAYFYKYNHAKDYLESLGDGGGNHDYYVNILTPAKNTVAQALAAYEYCAGYTDYEVSSSQATVSLTQAQLQQAKDTLDTLIKNNGLDPVELATAENKVSTAQLALEQAKEKYAGATIKAPYDGTILSIAGQVGDTSGTDTAGTSTFITIADLSTPQVEFSIDETDMDKVAVGEQATVTFDALPNQTFTGKVVRIYPSLVTSGSYQVVKGLIQLELTQENASAPLLKGLNGTVKLIQSSAENVLLVPVQSVHDLGDGTYSIMVVGSDNQLQMKVIELGLQDSASAEVKSGLSLGDVVSTGTVATK